MSSVDRTTRRSVGAFLQALVLSSLITGCIGSKPDPIGAPAVTPAPATATDPPVLPAAPAMTASPTAFPTPALFVCQEAGGRIVRESFPSAITGKDFNYRIYLPPCYGLSGKRYPVLILLHGYDPNSDRDNDDQWDRIGMDEAATAGYLAGNLPPMIIVMPNGNDASYGSDLGDGPFPRVVINELVPWIDVHYCTWPAAAERAIGGLSRGGYWAYYIAFSAPQLFSRVGGHSPYFYPPFSAANANPVNLVDEAPGIENLAMYFDHGTGDYGSVLLNVPEFVQRLEQRGITVTYVINDDDRGHSEPYWSAHLSDYLEFYSADWPRDISAYPDCSNATP